MPILRRRSVPPDVLEVLAGVRDERPLAWARAADDRPVVATDQAVHVPTRDGYARVPWERVERVTWDRDESQLAVFESAQAGERRPPRHLLVVEEPGDLVVVVRERVNASVVIRRDVTVDGLPVRVVGRRRPGRDGIAWLVTVDRGLDLGDPDVKARVDAAVALVRSEVAD